MSVSRESPPTGGAVLSAADQPLLAIGATFTAEPVEPALAFWIGELQWNYQVRFAPYHQVFQQLLDPASLLAGNRKGVNVVLVRLEDLAPGGSPAVLEENVRHFAAAVRSRAERTSTPLLVFVCPPSPACDRGAHDVLEAWLRETLADLPTVHFTGPADVHALYPVADPYDPHADELGHIPYTSEFFAALGTMIARRIHALRMNPRKVIVLDCDETLWQGVCAEDGPQGVCLDGGRRALQEFMLRQRSAGMLLCLASKNNPEDVRETFRLNPLMPLRLDHFIARRLNWEPKSANLAALAAELNLGLDSFIFVDDNPAECAEVQENCPEVLSIPLPAEPARIGAFLRHIWAFDRAEGTAEDRGRSELYQHEQARAQLQKKSARFEDFLAALRLEIEIGAMRPGELPRVGQLTRRTNQMNFTTVRRSDGEVRGLLEAGAECLTVTVRDRFGDYGLVGVMIFAGQPGALVVETFLLSCRALGRGVEHRMLARLGELAVERGLAHVDIPFVPTLRNTPAAALLAEVAAPFEERAASGSIFRCPAERLAATQYRPAAPPAAAAPAAGRPAAAAPRVEPDYLRIAAELADPREILARLATRGRVPEVPPNGSEAPRTALEKQVAEMWIAALGVPAIGIHDDFFDLGGHSLLAVQLLARARQRFQVELSLAVVYGGRFTIAGMAKAIEVAQIEQTAGSEYEELVRELEGLSEEEVRALLAEEQQAGSDDRPR